MLTTLLTRVHPLYPLKKGLWLDVSQMLSGQGVDLTSLLRSEGVWWQETDHASRLVLWSTIPPKCLHGVDRDNFAFNFQIDVR